MQANALPTLYKLLLTDVFTSRYFAVILWCCEDYYTYSVVIFAITMGAVWATTHEVSQNWSVFCVMEGAVAGIYAAREVT
jgi:hypothetical protein